MRNDDLNVGKADRHVVQVHRVAVLQPQAAAAAHAAADTAVAGMENRWQLVFGDHLVDRPGHAVVGVVTLHRGVELETLDAVLGNQPPRLACAHLALVRVDAGKRNHHVGVLLRGLGNLFIWDAPTTHLGLGVDREHHQANLALAVVGYGFFYGRPAAVAKVFVSRAVVLFAVVIKRVPATDLGVGVDVDGDQILEIHNVLLCFCRYRRLKPADLLAAPRA